MARPILRTDRAVAGNLKNKTKHCTFVLPGDNLSTNIDKSDVTVERTDGFPIEVQSARGVQDKTGAWFLVVRTKNVPKRGHGESEEISVTVTNPDTGETSPDPLNPPVDVVYFDEETIRSTRPVARLARRAASGARAVARGARNVMKKVRTAIRPARKKKR